MTSKSGAPDAPVGRGTPEAPDDHRTARSHVPRLAPQRRPRSSHGTDRAARAELGTVDRPVPVVQPALPAAAPPRHAPLGGTADADRGRTPSLREQVGGATLLVSDVRLAFILMNEARYQTFELIGIPRDQANLATLVAILMAADRLDAARRALQSGPRPSRADAILGLATCNEVLTTIGGAPLRQHPLLGPLVAFALLSASARPVLKHSIHSIRTASHDVRASFKHRYGHLAVAR